MGVQTQAPDWGVTKSPEWWEGRDYLEAGQLEEAQGGVGVPGRPTEVELMGLAQGEELSLRAQDSLRTQ